MNLYIYIFLLIGIFIFIFCPKQENFSKDTIVEGTNIVEKLKNNINIFNNNISTLAKTNIKGNNLLKDVSLYANNKKNYIDGANLLGDNVIKTINCADGSFIDDSYKVFSCDICPAGSFCLNAKKYICQPGSFSNANSRSCTRCAENTFSGRNASKCEPCPTGTISNIGSDKCQQPDTVIAIVDIIIVENNYQPDFANTHSDYTGVLLNSPTNVWIKNWKLYNNGNKEETKNNIRNETADNINTGSNVVTLWVKYDFVKKNSNIPILTDLNVKNWEKCNLFNICEWTEPKCDPGFIGKGKLTSESDTGCNRNGLCVKFEPIKSAKKIISSLAWSYSYYDDIQNLFSTVNPIYAYNINTSTKEANVFSDTITVSCVNNSEEVQSGCPNFTYIYLATGYSLVNKI